MNSFYKSFISYITFLRWKISNTESLFLPTLSLSSSPFLHILSPLHADSRETIGFPKMPAPAIIFGRATAHTRLYEVACYWNSHLAS